MKKDHTIQIVCTVIALPVLYLVSPLLVYSVASLMKVNRGMDNRFADALDVLYEPAQRLTEKWQAYDQFILWCLKITGQT